MEVAPNSPRQNVIGGFAIAPPGVTEAASFADPTHLVGSASPWIDVSGGSFTPILGGEVAFSPASGAGLPIMGEAAVWFSTTTYGLGALVIEASTGVPYRSLLALNTNHDPASSPTWWQLAFNFRGAWAASTAYAVGDVVTAIDYYGVLQTWVAMTAFTSGPTFLTSGGLTNGGWAEALVSGQIYYIVGISGSTIAVSSSPNSGAITFLSAAFGSVSIIFGVPGFGSGTGLTPAVSLGALFAQGTLWQPSSPPVCPAAPASALSYLAYNSTAGLYWTSNPAGTTAGDAVLGWVATSSSDILQASLQNVAVGTNTGGGGSQGSGAVVGGTGLFVPTSTGGPSGIDIMADVGGVMTPNGSAGWTHQAKLTGAVTLGAPIGVAAGDTFMIQIIQPAGSGNGYGVTFNSYYTGLSEFDLDMRKGRYSSLLFQAQSGGASAMLLLVAGNGNSQI